MKTKTKRNQNEVEGDKGGDLRSKPFHIVVNLHVGESAFEPQMLTLTQAITLAAMKKLLQITLRLFESGCSALVSTAGAGSEFTNGAPSAGGMVGRKQHSEKEQI